MNLLASLSILLIATAEGFMPSFKSHNTFFPFKDSELQINNIENHNIEPIINHVEKIKDTGLHKCNLFSHNCHFKESLDCYINDHQKLMGKQVVMKISSFLPHFDQIGHKVLHANNEFISYILSLDNVPDELKKDIILTSIKFAQHGDNFGSYLLQMYYDIVHYSL